MQVHYNSSFVIVRHAACVVAVSRPIIFRRVRHFCAIPRSKGKRLHLLTPVGRDADHQRKFSEVKKSKVREGLGERGWACQYDISFNVYVGLSGL